MASVRFPPFALLVLGCTGLAPASPAALVAQGAVLVELSIEEGGLDAPPVRTLGFRLEDGSTRVVDREAIAFVPRWREGAALVDPEHRLYEVLPDGRRRMLARGATGPLAVSGDGSWLAFAVEGELRVHDGEREQTLARGIPSPGILRFLPDEEVAFVAAGPGGIVGVWLTEAGEARCLTNCTLRTTEPWAADFVPPPVDASTFALEDGALSWVDPRGARHEIELGEVQP